MTASDNLINDTVHSDGQEAMKKTYSVPEIAQMLQISRTKAYELCKSGSFKIIKIGRIVRISKSSFDEWLNQNL